MAMREVVFAKFALGVALAALAGSAVAENAPGVSDTEIKIGQTVPYTGPVTAFSALAKGELAYFKMINEQGGINGRKLNLISLDDGYSPPRAVEQTRRLIEQDKVAFIFGTVGTAVNAAIQKYLNINKIPQLFIATGGSRFGLYKEFPWSIGGVQATFRGEARLYARYIVKEKPNAKIAVLYQNDDYGRDYVLGLKDFFGAKYPDLVREAVYEVTDTTVYSQVVTLQATGADVLLVVATPKFAAQAIRKVYDIGWKPMFFLNSTAIWVNTVIEPAGVEKAIGILSSAYIKDPGDLAWTDDPGMKEWRAFMAKYAPEADTRDQNYVNAVNSAATMVQVLKQAGNDLSRENIMRQAANLRNLELPMLLPGIKVNTSPTDHYPIEDMQMMRWGGKQWVRFGPILSTRE
jgi:ABC-type branched-subunit amino acid transport system substrate-binding protein